jgi:hypothetical protein
VIFLIQKGDGSGFLENVHYHQMNQTPCHLQQRSNEESQDDEDLTEDEQDEDPDRSELQQKLRQKIKGLQQQLRRSKKKLQSMKDLILHLQEKLVISTEQAGILHAAFDNLQLSLFQNAKDNLSSTPTGRRYSDEVKEFALTLYFYSPKAYRYVRSIIPLPNQSLLRKWSSSVNCEPGFFKEAFTAIFKTRNGESGNRGIRESGNRGIRESGNPGIGEYRTEKTGILVCLLENAFATLFRIIQTMNIQYTLRISYLTI